MSSPAHHALLSASSASRRLSAPPLPCLEQYFPRSTSEAAAEGTAAHTLDEYRIRRLLGDQFRHPTSGYQSGEMESLIDNYVSYAMGQYTQARQYAVNANISVEQKLDFFKHVPQGFDTGDYVIVSDRLLHIVDFRYGKGVRVEAKNNPQMRPYAIGAPKMFDSLYNIDEVEATIFQPRMANISTWTINVKELMHWVNTELKEKAEPAFADQGTVRHGPWCQLSACNTILRVRYNYHHKLTRFQLRSLSLLTDSGVAGVLKYIDDLNRWTHEVRDYAADLTINHGKRWPGYKVVEGRSIHHYKDEKAVAKIAEANSIHSIYQQKSLPTIKLEKQLGKKKFVELFSQEIVKPVGKPILVPSSDRRQGIGKPNPKDEFKEE